MFLPLQKSIRRDLKDKYQYYFSYLNTFLLIICGPFTFFFLFAAQYAFFCLVESFRITETETIMLVAS
jgi:hypothetical protein